MALLLYNLYGRIQSKLFYLSFICNHITPKYNILMLQTHQSISEYDHMWKYYLTLGSAAWGWYSPTPKVFPT